MSVKDAMSIYLQVAGGDLCSSLQPSTKSRQRQMLRITVVPSSSGRQSPIKFTDQASFSPTRQKVTRGKKEIRKIGKGRYLGSRHEELRH